MLGKKTPNDVTHISVSDISEPNHAALISVLGISKPNLATHVSVSDISEPNLATHISVSGISKPNLAMGYLQVVNYESFLCFDNWSLDFSIWNFIAPFFSFRRIATLSFTFEKIYLIPMRNWWWKILCILLLGYSIIAGFLAPVPALNIINETIRNLYFHVPMWFTMMILFLISFIYSIKYLRSGNLKDDIYASDFTKVGILFSVLGMLTGMEWAKFTWGEAWSNDPKQLGTALCMLIYFAYLILRGGMKDEDKRAKLSAVYNIFAFALMFPLLWVLPRMVDSLHPGNGGNPGFNTYDLDRDMRRVFYPAVIGWILMGVWLSNLKVRISQLKMEQENNL